jgi:GTPase SAR1 family protein
MWAVVWITFQDDLLCVHVQLVVGLDNAGKTSIVSALQKQPLLQPGPTVGFSKPACLHLHGSAVTLYDLGGGAGIRGIWEEYLASVHALFFVLDKSDTARYQEALEALQELVQLPACTGKIVLLYANKSDLSAGASPASVLERIMPDANTPCDFVHLQ